MRLPLILPPGMIVSSFNDSNVVWGLTTALSRWLAVPPSSIGLTHVNGYRIDFKGSSTSTKSWGGNDQDDGEGKNEAFATLSHRIFTSRMREPYGVEVGINVYATTRKEGIRLKLDMAGRYGHFNDHLHQSDIPLLQSALLFDLHRAVLAYKIVPGGIEYEVEDEMIEKAFRIGEGWFLEAFLVVLAVSAALMIILLVALSYAKTKSISYPPTPSLVEAAN